MSENNENSKPVAAGSECSAGLGGDDSLQGTQLDMFLILHEGEPGWAEAKAEVWRLRRTKIAVVMDRDELEANYHDCITERNRYREALAQLYNAAARVQVFVNSRERIEQTTGKQWFDEELAKARRVLDA